MTQHRQQNGWDQQLWGVSFTSSGSKHVILGTAWHAIFDPRYEGEPSRPLLFLTRRTARAWCEAQHAKYAGREDCCADWRFRPIRVRMTVRPA